METKLQASRRPSAADGWCHKCFSTSYILHFSTREYWFAMNAWCFSRAAFSLQTLRHAASNKVPKPILFRLSRDGKSSSFILFFRRTPVLKEAQSIIIWYQDSVLCHALIVMHGALTVWIRLSVLKIKVFGLFSDSEHFHLPLQNVALCSDEDRGARLRGKRSIS